MKNEYDTPERLAELVESINCSGIVGDEKLKPEECKDLFDWGWSHAVSTPKGIFVEVRYTGWKLVETEDEAWEKAIVAERGF